MDSDGAIRVAIVITGAILAAAYIFLGPVSFRPKKLPVAGLVNLGNSCFLNAILQAIAPCIAATTWLQNISNNSQESHFAAILFQTITAINCSETLDHTVLSAVAVLEALGRRCWVIGAGQQDAHEMYLCLTSALEEELHDDCKVVMPIHVLAASCHHRSIYTIDFPRLAETQFDRKLDQRMPLRGLLASQLRCQRCGYKCPIKMETFDSLSVTIPPSQMGHLSLLGCLQHFMTAEKVHDVDCEGCTSFLKTKSKSTFLKRLTIAKCPQTLCIHIARTAWMDSGIPVKRHDHVSFPEVVNTENFVHGVKTVGVYSAMTGGKKQSFWTWAGGDKPSINLERSTLNSFLMAGHLKRASSSSVTSHTTADKPSRPSPGNLYELKSVVEHVGDAYGGHFVTYRRGTPNTRYRNQWYSCSDTEIQEISLRKVLQCTAYMLFYERQLPRSSSSMN